MKQTTIIEPRNDKRGFLYENVNLHRIWAVLPLLRQGEHLSRHMGKPTICLGENKGADQLRSNCEADQRLFSRYSNSTILLKSEISSF